MQRLPIVGLSPVASAAEHVLRAGIEASGAEIAVERWERKAHQLSAALGEVAAPDVVGAMVEAPHKERAATLIGALSEDARTSGAVNAILYDGVRLNGYNSDVDGVRAGLAAILDPVAGRWPRQALVLGAGGGARAVVSVLIQMGFLRVAVFNRHLHKAEAVVAHFAKTARHMDLRALPWHDTILESELSKARLVVNASGIGVEAGESPIPEGLLPDGLILLDLVLNHASTPLMDAVRTRGGTVANGQAAFLTGQAVAFKAWTGIDAPADVLRGALAAHLGLPEEGLAVVGD